MKVNTAGKAARIRMYPVYRPGTVAASPPMTGQVRRGLNRIDLTRSIRFSELMRATPHDCPDGSGYRRHSMVGLRGKALDPDIASPQQCRTGNAGRARRPVLEELCGSTRRTADVPR